MPCEIPTELRSALEAAQSQHRQVLLEETTTRNARWFESEVEKLDGWAEDRRLSLKAELEDLDCNFKEAKKAARLAPTLPEKLERQRAARALETKRSEAWRAYDEAGREIESQKDALLDEVSRRLEQTVEETKLFTLRWHLV